MHAKIMKLFLKLFITLSVCPTNCRVNPSCLAAHTDPSQKSTNCLSHYLAHYILILLFDVPRNFVSTARLGRELLFHSCQRITRRQVHNTDLLGYCIHWSALILSNTYGLRMNKGCSLVWPEHNGQAQLK